MRNWFRRSVGLLFVGGAGQLVLLLMLLLAQQPSGAISPSFIAVLGLMIAFAGWCAWIGLRVLEGCVAALRHAFWIWLCQIPFIKGVLVSYSVGLVAYVPVGFDFGALQLYAKVLFGSQFALLLGGNTSFAFAINLVAVLGAWLTAREIRRLNSIEVVTKQTQDIPAPE